MEKPATLSDVARLAGVSYATADRVLNGRGGVSEKAARSVRAAVDELRYVRNVAAANLAQRRVYRLAAVLPAGPNAFFARVEALFAEAAQRLRPDRIRLSVDRVAAFDPGALRDRLEALAGDGVDGVAMVGSDDASTARAIAELRDRGIGVVTLVSDVPGSGRHAYVGIDNVVAGRTVARLVTLAHAGRPGRVLPVVGALSARDHADRLAGFREVIDPAIAIAPVIEGRDLHDRVEALVGAALDADAAITAIYSVGAGNSGLLRALAARAAGRARPRIVLHELVEHSRHALETGLVDIIVDQRPEEEVARAIAALRRLADRRAPAATGPIPPAIYVRDNLPPRPGAAPLGEMIS